MKNIINQKIIVVDFETKEKIADTVIKANDKVISSSSADKIVSHQLPNPNKEEKIIISLEHLDYQPLSLEITAKPSGQHIAGRVTLFLLGVLGVDGGTGTWFSYDKKVKLYMNAK